MARTVLVVEDEPTVRETLAEALTEEGLRVSTAEDGPQALERFRADKPDLVILDLMLPKMSGIEVCRIIRAESSVPILMLTARDSELDKVLGLELGADDYVTKPFSLRELQARIRALLRRSEFQGEPTPAPVRAVDLGKVHVDLAGHQILRNGEPLAVKPKAFELLAFLIRNAGQVFSREQLLDKVWGYDYAGETRTVDVHVHWLRKRVEEDVANPRLHPDRPRRGLRIPGVELTTRKQHVYLSRRRSEHAECSGRGRTPLAPRAAARARPPAAPVAGAPDASPRSMDQPFVLPKRRAGPGAPPADWQSGPAGTQLYAVRPYTWPRLGRGGHPDLISRHATEIAYAVRWLELDRETELGTWPSLVSSAYIDSPRADRDLRPHDDCVPGGRRRYGRSGHRSVEIADLIEWSR